MRSKKTRDNSLISILISLFEGLDGEGLTPEDFVKLTVKTPTGSVDLFTPTVKSCSELIEVGGMMRKFGVRATYDYITTHVIPKLEEMHEVGETEYHSVLIFDSPLLKEERENEDAMLSLNDDKGPLTDVASCFKCGEPKVHRKMAQTRSADEGMTAIFTCPTCKFTWSEG